MGNMGIIRAIGMAILILVGMTYKANAEGMPWLDVTIESQSGQSHDFRVELADTPDARSVGLMYREAMPVDHGMLFDFRRDRVVTMWMKNTLIPLDMLFLDRHGRIKKIAKRTVPYSEAVISSDRRVRYVLEINGGQSDQLGLKPGDQVKWTK